MSFFYFSQHKLEFRTVRLIHDYRFYSYFLVIALIATVVFLLPGSEGGKIGRLVGLILMVMVALMWFFKSLPYPEDNVKSDRSVLYINKKDTLTKIIQQVYYTGILGDNEKYDTIKTKELFKDVRWTEKIDYSTLNGQEWKRP
jgi:hypothetical protein